MIRLHLVNWVLKSEHRKKYLDAINDDTKIPFKVWGIDPALNIALQYGVAQNLLDQKSDTYSITPEGKSLLLDAKSKGCEIKEANYLVGIGKRITEKKIKEIVEKWN